MVYMYSTTEEHPTLALLVFVFLCSLKTIFEFFFCLFVYFFFSVGEGEPEDNLWELILFLHHVGPGN